MVYEPREDTLLLLSIVKKLKLRDRKVLDMGTGTGIIAITAAKKKARVDAVDIDKEALVATRKNARREGVKIMVYYSNLFSNVNTRYDYIFFNAPYLPRGARSIVKDKALIGGKHGYETLVEFIKQLNKHLTRNGKAFIVYSSLSKEEKILEAANNALLEHKELVRKHYFFEDIIVSRLERNRTNRYLYDRGINIEYFYSEGKHSRVYRTSNGIAKIPRKGFEKNIRREAEIIRYLNNTNSFFTPRLIASHGSILIEELVKGRRIEELVGEEKRRALFLFLLAARQLDIRNVKKEEMHMPRKHVLIGEGFYIIDYDRSHFSHNPGNLTQALHFVIHHLGIPIDKLINEMKKYKHINIEWKREELFIEILNKLGMSDLYEALRSLRDEELNRIIFRGISNDYLNVFRALGQIKRGNTLTYKELGIMLDMHARKVARILARNPLLIMIPCHRVIGVNDIGGYVLGVKRKKELLLQEAMP